MFGVLDGGCHLRQADKAAWWAHICGMCLALRDEHSQLARLATNYDAALLSVLFEAQAPHLVERTTNVCALRRFRRNEVITAAVPGARYAAAIGLNMAATKLVDHAADGDGWTRRVPGHQWLARRWRERSATAAQHLAFETALITAQVDRQVAVEQTTQTDILAFSRPTELAVGAAFRHTAVLAGCPQNVAALDQIGQMYGRIMYLLDSYRDREADARANTFNAFTATVPPHAIQQTAQAFVREAHAMLRAAFDQLVLPKPELARTLLIHSLLHTALHTFHGTRHMHHQRRSCGDWCDCSACECCECCECLECCGSDGCDCGCCDCSCDC